MKKIEVLAFNKVLDKVKDLKSGIRFKYAIIRNKELIKATVKEFEQLNEEVFSIIKDFENERVELIKEYGEPVENWYKIKDENIGTVNAKYELLREKYEADIEQYEKRIFEVAKIAEEPIEYDLQLRKVTIEDLPDDLLADEVQVLLPMIQE